MAATGYMQLLKTYADTNETEEMDFKMHLNLFN